MSVKTIKLIGADARFSASIAQLLKLRAKARYVLSDEGQIVLIDADSVEGRREVANHLDGNSIILTVMPSQFQHGLIVKKPVKVDELLDALDNVVHSSTSNRAAVLERAKEKEAVQDEVIGNPFAKFMEPGYLAKRKQEKKEQQTIMAEEVAEEPVIKNSHAVEEKLNTNFTYWRDKLSGSKDFEQYDIEDCLKRVVMEAPGESVNLYGSSEDYMYDMSDYATFQLFHDISEYDFNQYIGFFEYLDGIVLLFGDGKMVSTLPLKSFVAFAKVKYKDISIKLLKSTKEVEEILDQFNLFFVADALALLCCLILLEADGRIVNGQDIDQPLGIMALGKNITPPFAIPYSKEMDNIWCFRNVSLRETTELLTVINSRHIFSYYTMCALYGLFEAKKENEKSEYHLDLNTLLSELKKL